MIICDHGLPGENGLNFLSRVRHDSPYIQRILLTGHRDVDLAIRVINAGNVHRYLAKPANFSTVCEDISTGLEKRKEILSNQKIVQDNQKMVEENKKMQEKLDSWPYRRRQLRALSMESGRFIVKTMGIYLIGSMGFFICGVCLLMVLYLIRTIAGVDLLVLGLDDPVTRFHNWAVSLVWSEEGS